MAASERVRIGVVGLGGFGRQHMAAWAAIPSVEVLAVCDVRPDAVAEMAAKYGVQRQYSAFDAVLSNPDIDAVDLVTPADQHAEQALQVLAAGKHLFVEKPLAETADDAQRVVDAARTANLRLQTGLVSRFGAPYAHIKEQVDSAAFGDIVSIRAKRNIPQAWAVAFQHAHPVFETAIHDLDLIVWYAGTRCQTAYAQHRSHLGLRYPDTFVALLTFESGALVTLESTWHVPPGAPTGLVGAWDVGGIIDADLEVVGTKRTAKYALANPGLSIWGQERSYYPELSLFPTLHGLASGAIREELAHFARTVQEGRDSTVAPAQDAVATIRIADAILRSAESGQVVRLDA